MLTMYSPKIVVDGIVNNHPSKENIFKVLREPMSDRRLTDLGILKIVEGKRLDDGKYVTVSWFTEDVRNLNVEE